MYTQSFFRLVAAIAVTLPLFLTSACSKKETVSEASTSAVTPTPSATASATPSPTISPLPTGSPFADVQLRLRELESKLDKIFSESFRDFGTLFGPSTFGSSVDLREQKDKYVARIYPPSGDTSKVNAKIDNGALHITIAGTTASENYDQIISLPQPVRADEMKVDRRQNFVVVTIPKSTPAVAAASPAPPPEATATSSPFAGTDWDQRITDEMNRMQARMDQVFQDAFPSDFLNSANALRLGSTVSIDDQKDQYVVHFALPSRDLSNVNVKFENGRLHLTAQEEKSTSTNAAPGTMESVERGHYEEMIALPGPVKDSEMKVERKGETIDVTLPKA
jgi:HSP20 family molecular chaperone IbpA